MDEGNCQTDAAGGLIMAKLWIHNSLEDRLAMLDKTTDAHSGMIRHAVEKDWWVTVTLQALFRCSCKDFLLFKGGTSLSKAWNLIDRFSEDIDIAVSHTFFGIDKTNKSQKEKLRKTARSYILETLSKELDEQMSAMGIEGYNIENVTTVISNGVSKAIDSDKDPTVILVHYPSILDEDLNYIPPRVKIEISCLSMDVPTEMCHIKSYIADSFPDEDYDSNGIYRTVVPSRTFLEKIFLLAEEFQKDRPRYVRMSRHLYDLEKLMDTDFGRSALSDSGLYEAIIRHRSAYYALKYVDYAKLGRKEISFLPPEHLLSEWRDDYENMKTSFIYGESLDFDTLMNRMRELQRRLNDV